MTLEYVKRIYDRRLMESASAMKDSLQLARFCSRYPGMQGLVQAAMLGKVTKAWEDLDDSIPRDPDICRGNLTFEAVYHVEVFMEVAAKAADSGRIIDERRGEMVHGLWSTVERLSNAEWMFDLYELLEWDRASMVMRQMMDILHHARSALVMLEYDPQCDLVAQTF